MQSWPASRIPSEKPSLNLNDIIWKINNYKHFHDEGKNDDNIHDGFYDENYDKNDDDNDDDIAQSWWKLRQL
jgi:hypothetical protein